MTKDGFFYMIPITLDGRSATIVSNSYGFARGIANERNSVIILGYNGEEAIFKNSPCAGEGECNLFGKGVRWLRELKAH